VLPTHVKLYSAAVTEALAIGVAYGIAAGIAPGKLLALVIRASRDGGTRAGARTALAPVVTDAALVAAAIATLAQFSDRAVGVVGGLGSLLVLRMAWDSWHDAGTADPMAGAERVKPAGKVGWLQRGVLVNALSPYPVLFWFTIGGPSAIRLEREEGLLAACVLIGAFLASLVACRSGVAVFVGVLGRQIGGRSYRVALAAAAVVLVAAGSLLAVESIILIV
jgi:threonine/homoserine/homoserine lactone efflux protein